MTEQHVAVLELIRLKAANDQWLDGLWLLAMAFEEEKPEAAFRFAVRSLLDNVARSVTAATPSGPPNPAQEASAAERQLAEIRKAISDYHFALDSREHGGVAQDRAFNRIREVLDMPWQPGREKAERAAAAVSPCPGRTAAASAE